VDIQGYVNEIRTLYASGQTTEHSFRPALSRLFTSIDGDVSVINEPKRKTDVGAPDFVFNRNGIAIGWCEAKDIGKDVRKFAANDYSKEQKGRYTKGLPNLIYTNGLDFEFIRDGDAVAFVTIADPIPSLPAHAKNFPELEHLLRNFAAATPATITTAEHLAKMMAGKAALIKDIMGKALLADIEGGQQTDLTGQYEAFKANLIHDITVAEFADIYAETIAYGLFAARLHDTTLDSFTRAEALDLLPKSNPFLRSLFGYIAGVDLDDRIRWVIDELCGVFIAADLPKILKNFGKFTGRNDPFLHFYETFLAEYNPAKRKARGVWYTPEPVVNFIVRAVDEVLKTEFGLADGLADTSRITIDWDTGQNNPKTGKPATIKKEVHRVQILDPATGTGTFLAEVVKLVARRVQDVAPGQWSGYVERDLIPRLHGFELLMASYAMCHMKLDMIFTELGYKPSANPPRLGVYLTNSLEEGERVEQTLFGLSRAIANEAKAASDIKRQTPIMCVIGNPPYSGHSSNKGPWIEALMEPYMMEPGGNQRLQERNPKWVKKDEHKFIRFAEHMIAKNEEGVLGFITSHGYLADPTLRGMRWHLLDTFDKIYALDLHGNSKKKEVCPDGSADTNVFDIMQGVAIIIAVKHKSGVNASKRLADVLHGDEWGTRDSKYASLWGRTLKSGPWRKAEAREPLHQFVPRDFTLEQQYLVGFSMADAMPIRVLGFQTHRDKFAIAFDQSEMRHRIEALRDPTIDDAVLRARWSLSDNRDWQLASQRHRIAADPNWESSLTNCLYRPFDVRSCHLNYATMDYPRNEIVQHVLAQKNLSLLIPRQLSLEGFQHVLVSDLPAESCAVSSKTKEQNQVIPLYLYPEEGTLDQSIRLNFDPKFYARIRDAAGLTGPMIALDGTDTFRTTTGEARPDEVKVFDYIYGVLHSPAFRETYAEFLKIDFPRVPFPRDPETFAHLSSKGEALRRLHLMEPDAIGATPYSFEGDGESVVDKPRYEAGQVWINETQYFDAVPAYAWEFHIGGYQPAQKWLKDRKGRALSYDEIRHYQRIIKILSETGRIMAEIELPMGADLVMEQADG
jgi:predicted helicase